MNPWDASNFAMDPFNDPYEEKETTTEKRLRRAMGEVYPQIGYLIPPFIEKAFQRAEQVPQYKEPYQAKFMETLGKYFPTGAKNIQEGKSTFVPTYGKGLRQNASQAKVYTPASFRKQPTGSKLPQKRTFYGLTQNTVNRPTTITQTVPSTIQTGYEGQGYVPATYTSAPTWQNSRYYEAGAITPDIVNHPSFKAFEANMRGAMAGTSRTIANEMAKRGILKSGASKQAYMDLASNAQGAIAKEMGRLAEKPLQETFIEKYINEPKRRTDFERENNLSRMKYLTDKAVRRTDFNASEANRGTEFGKWLSDFTTGQSEKEADRVDSMNRWLGDIRQREAERDQKAKENEWQRMIDFAKTETDAEKDYQETMRDLDLRNWALQMDAMKDPINLLMHVVSEGSAPLGSMMRTKAVSDAATGRQKAQDDKNALQTAALAAQMFGYM